MSLTTSSGPSNTSGITVVLLVPAGEGFGIGIDFLLRIFVCESGVSLLIALDLDAGLWRCIFSLN